MQESTEEKEDGDCWIPLKIPERPIVVRSAEVAREINHRRFGDQDFEMSNSLDIENPEIMICDFMI